MKAERLSSTSVRKECLQRKFMKTSWKSLGRSLLRIAQRAAAFKRGRESVGDGGWSGSPKDAMSDENVKVVHTLFMCDRRQDLQTLACEVGISFGAVSQS